MTMKKRQHELAAATVVWLIAIGLLARQSHPWRMMPVPLVACEGCSGLPPWPTQTGPVKQHAEEGIGHD
jgi:hypothetical protein